MFSGEKVLVTGGTGVIGRELVDLLSEAGAKVRVACFHEPVDPRPVVQYLRGDLTCGTFCARVVKGMRYVFHLASVKGSVGVGRTRAADFFVKPLLMNTHMMEESRKAGVERYLFASSVCVYAPAATFIEDRAWDAPPHPSDAFAGWAKRMGELQAQAYREQYGWERIAVVRPVNTYGPHDNFDPQTALVIPALIHRVLSGENPLVVWGDGSAIRDFLYSRDAARGSLLAMERFAGGVPVNLGSGKGYSIRELVEAVLKATGKSPKVVWDSSRPSGEHSRVADIGRARKELGFEPRVGLSEGIARTVRWVLDNPDRVRLKKTSFNV
ncbi:MAG: NAD-dependent epimerase/dehydratase family protein [Elusimicrobiota bacterium]